MRNRIYSVDNAKASKAVAYGYLDAIHYMAPASSAGVGNLCGNDTAGCRALCLGEHAGHAAIIKKGESTNSVLESRKAKARRFVRERKAYLADMVKATQGVIRTAARLGLTPVCRPNGGTDIAWESIRDADGLTLMERFNEVQWMDYTKSFKRAMRFARGEMPPNYHLTFSRTESNEPQCREILAAGGNVAVVFAGELPSQYLGARVISGDDHDLRFLDPRGVVVGLRPKGARAKADTSGFVVRL